MHANDVRPAKRRRLSTTCKVDNASSLALPPWPVVDVSISTYFLTVHHWIPVLHEGRLLARLKHDPDDPDLRVLLHAIVASSLNHITDIDAVGLSPTEIEHQISASTTAALLGAVDQLNVENAQALIILAFEKLGACQWEAAWSILGSLTRTLHYLQLTNEEQSSQKKQLLGSLNLLQPSQNHAESEERRRVFWNAFLLDRLCSVTCGWPTALTSESVSRRLPCNGALWRNGKLGTTPYFGVWSRSQAKLGHSISHLAAHRTVPSESDPAAAPSPPASTIDITDIGAFAYRIEATESMSQISSFFLRQPVDLTNSSEVRDWLTRFKELDLRLVHWKLFLPPRWRDVDVTRPTGIKSMDPNLTLAHLIHNTSTVLLHQHIAYPSPALKQAVNLPSSCSAETCQLAVVEIAVITARYLNSTKHMILNAEIIICVYIAALALLVHSYYNQTPVNPQFANLITSLKEMSTRWNGPHSSSQRDLAATAASKLQEYSVDFRHDAEMASEILLRPVAEALFRPNAIQRPSPQQPPQQLPVPAGRKSFNSARPTAAISRSADQNSMVRSDSARSQLQQFAPQHVPSTHPPTVIALEQPPVEIPEVQQPYGLVQQRHMSPPRQVLAAEYSHVQNNYTVIQEAFLPAEFQHFDRVIMSDTTNFDFDAFDM